ncbi:MAG TPA: hypothetical protein VFH48_21775 [Chloroflexota bacterium]|nr:hypothetical protein [Chloroflexota bacterium]
MDEEQRITIQGVARLMADRVARTGVVDQAAAVERIDQLYSRGFVYE